MPVKALARTPQVEVGVTEPFSGWQRLTMPGQDPARVEAIFQAMVEQFQPQGPIEAMWVSDIAALSVRIEYLRKCHRAAYLVRLRRQAFEQVRYGSGVEIEAGEAHLLKQQVIGDFADDTADDTAARLSDENHPFARLLGVTALGSLRAEEDFMALEFAAMRERDRIIQQIDRRRRNAMLEAVRIIDGECNDA